MNDLDCTCHYYLDGQSVVEQRNGSDQVLKQQVWGITYVDELIQVAINSDPSADSTCEQAYWALQDANYNVAGVVDSAGTLVERCEYTPYGQRTVFFSPSANDSGCHAPTLISGRRTIGGVGPVRLRASGAVSRHRADGVVGLNDDMWKYGGW